MNFHSLQSVAAIEAALIAEFYQIYSDEAYFLFLLPVVMRLQILRRNAHLHRCAVNCVFNYYNDSFLIRAFSNSRSPVLE